MPGPSIARRALLGAVAASLALIETGPGFAASAADRHLQGSRQAQKRPERLLLPERVIAIDPGHGGADPGTISADGTYEKQITLATAVELARQLALTGRFHPVLTRRRDVYVALRERVARARAARADLLVSIHADALPNSDIRGLSVYTLSDQASDRETATLALRENREGSIDGVRLSRQAPEIGNILLDLARRQTNNRSLTIAQAIVSELGHDAPLLEKPHRAAGFAVLTAPDVPSVLVELGCLSNPREERLLRQPAYQRRLAEGLVRAIGDYFTVYS